VLSSRTPKHGIFAACCARRERPQRRRAAEQSDELAPPQWIELHSVLAAKSACSISNWHGSVSEYRHFDDDMPPDIETTITTQVSWIIQTSSKQDLGLPCGR
jgi:hypothetical protein